MVGYELDDDSKSLHRKSPFPSIFKPVGLGGSRYVLICVALCLMHHSPKCSTTRIFPEVKRHEGIDLKDKHQVDGLHEEIGGQTATSRLT